MLPYKIAIIPCASKKIETSTPIQAIHLYSKSMYFKRLADLASRLAEEIWILSAKHGLIKSNDLILPYDDKMTLMKALKWKLEGRIIVPQNAVCLLSPYGVYETCIASRFNRFLDIGLSALAIGEQVNILDDIIRTLPDPKWDIWSQPDGKLILDN